jgi:hypothetical protein
MSGGWRIVGASVRGASNAKLGRPCQDVWAWEVVGPDFVVVAVADGAGSAYRGKVGAEVASRVAVEFLGHCLRTEPATIDEADWRARLTQTLLRAREAVEAEARRRALVARDLATTLILVAAGPEITAAAQVGDGAAIVGDRTGGASALTVPPVGEYANETTFLTDPEAIDRGQVAFKPEAAAHVVVISDGLQRLALTMPGRTLHERFFSPLFTFLARVGNDSLAEVKLTEWLGSPRIRDRTNDDVTLVLATMGPHPTGGT